MKSDFFCFLRLPRSARPHNCTPSELRTERTRKCAPNADMAPQPRKAASDADDSVRMYRLQEVEVTATRATRNTPVAYSDIQREAIARNSYGFDIPSLIALTPSVVATNENRHRHRRHGHPPARNRRHAHQRHHQRRLDEQPRLALDVLVRHPPTWISSVGTVQVQIAARASRPTARGAFGGAITMTTDAPANRIRRRRIALLRFVQHQQAGRAPLVGPAGRPLTPGRTADAHRVGGLHRPRSHGPQILHVPGGIL